MCMWKRVLRQPLRRLLLLIPMRWVWPLRRVRFKSKSPLVRATTLRLLKILCHRPIDLAVSNFTLADAPDVRLANSDAAIVRHLFWLGQTGYEGFEVECWKRFCRQATRIVEIGANIGYYTVQGAKAAPHADYVAVEPHPKSAAKLRENLRLNELVRVTVLEAALVGQNAPSTMRLMIPDADPDEVPAGAYLADAQEGNRLAASTHVEVSCESAISVVAGADLLKLDVEGYENEILTAVADAIEKNRPTIVIEVLRHTPLLRETLMRLCEVCNYKIFAVAPNCLIPLQVDDLASVTFQTAYGTRDIAMVAPAHWLVAETLTQGL